jgi:hypothetical protein
LGVRNFQIAKGTQIVGKHGYAGLSENSLPGGISEREPPDPISNSEVKTLSADGSVGSPHVRVGHRQALNSKPLIKRSGAFSLRRLTIFPNYQACHRKIGFLLF